MAKGIRTAITARRAAAIAIAGAAAAALSACSAGNETQTDMKVSAIAGVNVDAGDLALRDLQVEFDSAAGYAAGESAALRVWIGNEGEQEVSLTGVAVFASAEDAAEAAAVGDPEPYLAGTVTYVDPAAPADEPSESPSGDTETPSGDASESASEAPTPEEPEFEGDPAIDVPIAPSEYARLDQGVENGPYLLIEDLAADLPVGDTLWIVFTFSDGSTADAAIPTGQDLTGEEEREYYEPQEEAEGH
ncbi:hypothetical protein SAMN05216298_2582 [Glycomyces sambucus]|uniref:Copper(I)-binding protein n=1 Tax=Glycomyces sambucus TaxID=380244 RepID=A0A1G9H332_9ACTN|nr:hypothetical protein [Glycomyces sambucus]SDL07224.1 hypothetical protein SAMN05216298_2582 [Glycomyces sambucus]